MPREDGSLRIAHVQFLGKSHTRGSHHNFTSEDFATDVHIVEHTKEYLDTLQPCALPLTRFLFVLTFPPFPQVMSPKLAPKAQQQSQIQFAPVKLRAAIQVSVGKSAM